MSVSFSATQCELIAIAHELEGQQFRSMGFSVFSEHLDSRDIGDHLTLDPRVRSHADALVRSFHRFMREHKAMVGGDSSVRISSVRVYHRLVVAACQDLEQVLER